MRPGERREQRGHQPATGRSDDADAGVAGGVGAPRRHVGGDRVQLALDPPRPVDHRRALFGELTALTVDEGGAELLLQPGDVAGDVGLHGEQRSRGGGERPVVGDGQERVQLAKIHLGNRYYISVTSS